MVYDKRQEYKYEVWSMKTRHFDHSFLFYLKDKGVYKVELLVYRLVIGYDNEPGDDIWSSKSDCWTVDYEAALLGS